MGMVFCRGCGKEIHESAPACPLCGALQYGPAQPTSERSAGKLIGWGSVWVCVFWVVSLFITGFIAGALNPEDPGAAGERAGDALAIPYFFVAILLSALLTYLGKLPGTKRTAA